MHFCSFVSTKARHQILQHEQHTNSSCVLLLLFPGVGKGRFLPVRQRVWAAVF
jgi:hypothetical protein